MPRQQGLKTRKTSKITVFTDKFPLLGPVICVLSVQYFVAQLAVAAAWPFAFSWRQNDISDLGNTACGIFSHRLVCSPDYMLMNASFILLGIIMALGSLLVYQEFRKSRASLFGFSLFALAGIGSILVGLFPENTVHWLHATSAVLALGVGNAAIIILAFALRRVCNIFRIYSFLSGFISLLAFKFFLAGIDFGLGLGAIERIASYPQTLWLILFGLYMTSSHFRSRPKPAKH
jgi:hypothetical membrane protein